MGKKLYTGETANFLKANFEQYTLAELTKQFNKMFKCKKSMSAIKYHCQKHGIVKNVSLSEDMINFLRANFENISHEELAKRFNKEFGLKKTAKDMAFYCSKNRIIKRISLSEDMISFLRANFENISHEELTCRFNKEFNLKKRTSDIQHYCSKCGLKKKISHSFPVGTERRRASKGGLVHIKVDHGKGKVKHRLLWERVNGPIPKGHFLIFADGNIENLNIENLILVTDNEYFYLLTRRLINVDEELTRTGINVAKIKTKIAEYNKKKCAQESIFEQQSSRGKAS